MPAPFTTAPVPVREVARRQRQREEKPTGQRYQLTRHSCGHQHQHQPRTYHQNHDTADPLQHPVIRDVKQHNRKYSRKTNHSRKRDSERKTGQNKRRRRGYYSASALFTPGPQARPVFGCRGMRPRGRTITRLQTGHPGRYPGMLPEHSYSASMRTIIVVTSVYANVPRGSVSWCTARSHSAFC